MYLDKLRGIVFEYVDWKLVRFRDSILKEVSLFCFDLCRYISFNPNQILENIAEFSMPTFDFYGTFLMAKLVLSFIEKYSRDLESVFAIDLLNLI